MSDQCKHCQVRGDRDKCQGVVCSEHESWVGINRERIITALRTEVVVLRRDSERLDWLEKESPNISFNCAGSWVIDCGGDKVYSATTFTEAIDKAMEKQGVKDGS